MPLPDFVRRDFESAWLTGQLATVRCRQVPPARDGLGEGVDDRGKGGGIEQRRGKTSERMSDRADSTIVTHETIDLVLECSAIGLQTPAIQIHGNAADLHCFEASSQGLPASRTTKRAVCEDARGHSLLELTTAQDIDRDMLKTIEGPPALPILGMTPFLHFAVAAPQR